MKVTIEDIAQRAGVSKSTVSNVLNNRKNKVGQKTWERVLGIAEDIGYVPRRNIRPNADRKTKRIALVLSEASSEAVQSGFLFPGFFSGVADTCNNWKYQLLITTAPDHQIQDYFFEELADHSQVDGFILPEIRRRDYRIKILKDRKIPTICVGKPESNQKRQIDWVDIDLENLVRETIERLIDRQLTPIAYLGLSRQLVKTSQEERGYILAHEKKGLMYQRELLVHCDRDAYRAKKLTLELLKHRPRIIYTGNEVLAMGCYEACLESGLSIPADIGVVSTIESKVAQCLKPSLAGIDRKSYELGLHAGDYLIKLIEGFLEETVHVYLASGISNGESLP
ncbi:MAG TPA: LacI family DNA-binding transcriptional regulator [Atribacteraceae bacterium]|nr:LacI family DNA-binding transcriptional regulator [Atribacteraceae bacterium]